MSYCCYFEETSHADARLCFSLNGIGHTRVRKDGLQGVDMFEKRVDGEVSSTLCLHQRARSFCPEYVHKTGTHQAPPGDHRKSLSIRSSRRIPYLGTCHSACQHSAWSPFVSMEQHQWQDHVFPGPQKFQALYERYDARADETHLGLCHMITILCPCEFRTTR